VTVIGASAQDIADMILRRDQSIAEHEHENVELQEYRKIYGYVTLYVDELRIQTSTLADAPCLDIIITFLGEHIVFMKRLAFVNPLEVVESLTTLGMLHRVYGQYLQLRHAANSEGLIVPASFHRYREHLTANRVDDGHFAKAETAIFEALKLCENKLGIAHPQNIVLHNEVGLIHRDKGEYKQACKEFSENVNSIGINHPSEKDRFAEAYFNWGMAWRDRACHTRAAYLIRVANIFRESAGRDLSPIRAVYRLQFRYAYAYLLIWAIMFGVHTVSVDLIHKDTKQLLVYLVIFWLVYKMTLLIFDRFIIVALAARIEGIKAAVRWAPRSASNVLSDLASRIIDARKEAAL